MSLLEIENQTLRRDILIILETSTGYENSERHIATSLRTDFGHRITADRLKGQLAWLQEQSLITLHSIAQTSYNKAKLTERGLDVAQENTVFPNIARKELS